MIFTRALGKGYVSSLEGTTCLLKENFPSIWFPNIWIFSGYFFLLFSLRQCLYYHPQSWTPRPQQLIWKLIFSTQHIDPGEWYESWDMLFLRSIWNATRKGNGFYHHHHHHHHHHHLDNVSPPPPPPPPSTTPTSFFRLCVCVCLCVCLLSRPYDFFATKYLGVTCLVNHRPA